MSLLLEKCGAEMVIKRGEGLGNKGSFGQSYVG